MSENPRELSAADESAVRAEALEAHASPWEIAIATLHAEIDRMVAPLVAQHAARLACRRGCSGCCVDGIRVHEVEALPIRAALARLAAGSQPHPKGACAFLDAEGACRVYEARPYVCRTQGLPLRWLDEDEEGQIVELRDICELNEAGPTLTSLAIDSCFTLGAIEAVLARLEEQRSGGAPKRVALRDLWPCLTGDNSSQT